jgi:NAD(P)-dependent dehydrogenase (short-subunit alcohol dehydrogenase family)
VPGELSNKVIVLTGGGDRTGAECTLAYGREGATVATLDCDLVSALCSNASAASTQSTTIQESPTLPSPFTKPLRPSGTTCSASPSNPSTADAALFLTFAPATFAPATFTPGSLHCRLHSAGRRGS